VQTYDGIAALRERLSAERAAGRRIALVPTMGSLHEGHLRLFDRARGLGDIVVASIFVNPLQFGPAEDFDRYPRDLDRDAELARGRGVACLFTPATGEMYPSGPNRVLVRAGPLAERLCGRYRPGHFDGVLTVVAKLFNIVRPDVAVFGRKDFQQAVLIRAMVEELNFGVSVDVAPTTRESDGLAMSSRNVRLSADERAHALAVPRALEAAQRAFTAGERSGAALARVAAGVIEADGAAQLQYVHVIDPRTLDDVEEAAAGSVMAIAAFVGDVRLIDNHVLT
jgi:pantoate--beta-alanine ligase